mmetsp:Transcript_16591/g.24730  ORF Transcript_16591/g.24730 Transcript_16591/m.24730 type:complete len:395 (-) Transcript_16591:1183-2367(-)
MPAERISPPPSPDLSSRHTFTHLTYSRHHLIDIAKETIKISENGHYKNNKGETIQLKRDLDWSVEHCVHYEHEFDFNDALKQYDEGNGSLDKVTEGIQQQSISQRSLLTARAFQRTSFLVVSASWLEAASELQACDDNVRVGVLNSASGTTPGGRFLKGTVSQEDCLCRASLLYSCISQPKFQSEGRFYGKNRSFRYGTSNCVIFSPDVPVIREDTVEGKLLDRYEKVSFVSLPAPNAFTTNTATGKEYNDIESEERQKGLSPHARNLSVNCLASLEEDADSDELFEQKRRALLASLSDRIHRALSAFVLGGCTDLVLPAFGCGVHGNDPAMVAEVFREMLSDPHQFGGRFRTVVFAIPPSRKQNYQAFAAYFHKQQEATMKKAELRRGATSLT